MIAIDEKSRRLPTFDDQESVPVVFGDGQEWFLPRPHINVFALFADGKARRETSNSFGQEFQAKIARVDLTDEFADVCDLAADLLRRNYDLPDADLSALLRYDSRDEDSRSWMTAVYSVALGLDAPKAPAGGSASRSA